jgi:hypothetical protein
MVLQEAVIRRKNAESLIACFIAYLSRQNKKLIEEEEEVIADL